MYICTYIHIYIYTHTHAYTHAHIQTCQSVGPELSVGNPILGRSRHHTTAFRHSHLPWQPWQHLATRPR